MQRFLIVLSLIFASAAAANAQSADDKTQVIGVVNKLFAEMAAANPAGILGVHTADSQLVAVYKLKDGKTRIETIDGDKFSKMFTDKSVVLKEEMYAPNAEVYGDMALVWGRYVFFVGDKLSHCGVNTFNLVRTAEGWKIANGASTIDRTACTDSEKAMRPKAAK